MFILFDEAKEKAVAIVGVVAESQADQAFALPEGAGSDLRRYSVVKGKLVDAFKGKTDKEVEEHFIAQAVVEDVPVTDVPVVKPPLTKLAFMNLFTMEELAGIYTAAKSEVMIELFLEKVKFATESAGISMSDPDMSKGLSTLAAIGLLTPERAEEILA